MSGSEYEADVYFLNLQMSAQQELLTCSALSLPQTSSVLVGVQYMTYSNLVTLVSQGFFRSLNVEEFSYGGFSTI